MDYFSFEDVMKELELGEEELKRMVSEGELRAFRDENKMKFKKEDVESLRKGRITEPTIILPSTPTNETQDETVLDLDIGHETEALTDTSAHLAAVKGQTPGDTDADLVVPTEEVSTENEETFIEEDTDTGLTTEPLRLPEETADETVAAEAVAEEVAPPPPRRRTGQTGVNKRVSARIPVAVEEEIEKKRPHWAWTLFIFMAFLTSAYGGFFAYDTFAMDMGKKERPSELTAGMSKWVLQKFWDDTNWVKFHQKRFHGKEPPFGDPDTRIKHQEYRGITFDKAPAFTPSSLPETAAPQP